MRVDFVRDEASLLRLFPEWDRLAEEAHGGLPFVFPDWHIAWWRHMRARQMSVRDRLAVATVRDSTGSLVAVAPLMVTSRPSVGPLRVKLLQFFGADRNITEVRRLTCRPGRELAALSAIHAACRENPPVSWDRALWTGLRAEDEAALIEQASGAVPGRDVPMFVRDLPASWEDLVGGLSRNMKEALRKARNSPKRDGVDLDFDAWTEPEQLRAGLPSFLSLHANRAQQEHGTPHPDVFAGQASRDFLFDVCDRFGARGRVALFQVRHGERVVASRIGFVLGDWLYLYFSGSDPAYGKYSVATTLVARALQWAIARGMRSLNLSTGEDLSKLRWGPTQILFRDVFEVAPTVRAQLLNGALERAQTVVSGERFRRILGRAQ